MRHRASRPFFDQWRRLPRATARPIGAAAKVAPMRAAIALLVTLGAGTTAFVTVASDGDDSVEGDSPVVALDDRGSTTSRAGERLTLDLDRESAGPTERSPGKTPTVAPPTPAATESDTPVPTPTEQPTEELPAPTEPVPSETPTPSPSPAEATSRAPAPEDTTAPRTSLSEDYPDGRTAVFSFSADETASFTCSLDGGGWTSCASPTTYSDLGSGWHTFAVQATDTAGNADPTPAETSWHANGGPGSDD